MSLKREGSTEDGPIAKEPRVQEPLAVESSGKTHNSESMEVVQGEEAPKWQITKLIRGGEGTFFCKTHTILF
jgi:hypothetical protein